MNHFFIYLVSLKCIESVSPQTKLLSGDVSDISGGIASRLLVELVGTSWWACISVVVELVGTASSF